MRGVFLGLAAGAAVAMTTGTGGCAEDCAPYVECTTAMDLRWVDCGIVHRFNDGANLSSSEAAYGKCFCSVRNEPCGDGRTLDVCFAAHYDGREGGFFSDGTTMEAGAAFALCRGFETCTVVRDACDVPYYFLECVAGAEIAWLGSDGTVHASRAAAEAACRRPGSACRGLASCAEVGGCGPSTLSCTTSDPGHVCRAFPDCSFHSGEFGCNEDDACTWEGA